MKILLTTLDGNLYPVEVSPDLELLNLKALCELETQIPLSEMSLTFNGVPLNDDSKTLQNYAVKENDILMVQKIIPRNPRPAPAAAPASNIPLIDFGSIVIPPTTSRPSTSRQSNSNTTDVAYIRRMLMSNPVQYELLKQRFPELANALERNDAAKVRQLMEQLSSGEQAQFESDYSFSSNELFDAEAQQRIAENIRLQNIQQNMESALEYMPEAFGNVIMLYIDCQVNGHHVKAFVDSGAQMTIMSAACAERCGIMRLVDTRWAGIAKGVGTQKIVGRVHLAQIQIEKSFLTTAFSILENQPMDMLLGLDILRRHQCIIDLERNVLVIKSANVETKFLSESDLPAFARADDQADKPPNQE